MQVAIVAHRSTPTTAALARSRPDVQVLAPEDSVRALSAGDLAIARLDVSDQLDGIENGLWELARLEAAGVRVLNPPRALIAAHDKLATSRVLAEAGVPHPRTVHVDAASSRVSLPPPFVVKPRFGSWGRDVTLCRDVASLRRRLAEVAERPWFAAHGALVQELVPPRGYDVRVVVAGGQPIGAVRRIAAPGEWRTNVALGAHREPFSPPAEVCELAVKAAQAIDGDLVGVDLLPCADGYVVIELNGAVEFNEQYAQGTDDVFARALEALLPDPVAAVA
ncbi:MAG TPA: RimK family alpha-L-glutamate ligase [Gaiellaceae bacterium]|nr:RimK family alpha-L-glutamate ligase [Gaiellaceae bacterium]